MLESGIRQRGAGRIAHPEFASVGEDAVIASAVWSGDEGEPRRRYMVMRIRDGKIIDLQGCTSRSQAERFANRH